MANKSGSGVSTVLLGVVAVLLFLGFVGCSEASGAAEPPASEGTLTATDVQIHDVTQLGQLVGAEAVGQGLPVGHVAADEGFWLDLSGGRVWVTLVGPGESPYTVRDGDVVSFRGRIAAHGPAYPAPLGMCSQADHDALSGQGAHIDVPFDALWFGVG